MKITFKSKLIGLILLTSVAFGPSLFNDFSGDDRYFLTENTFYEDPKNISKLFSKDYNVNSNDYYLKNLTDKGTGSIAYRPVLTLTYFWDKNIWGENPFGFHLTNLLLHIANVILIFFIFNQIIPKSALLIAAIFSIHPIHTEAICSIGYRADALAAFWSLGAIWLWTLFRETSHKKYLILASLGFFLSIFTKESAVPTLLIFILYDIFISEEKKKLLPTIIPFALPLAILSFYFYIYFIVFPNNAIEAPTFTLLRLQNILLVLAHHFFALLWPFQITIIPPLYNLTLNRAGEVFSFPIFLILNFIFGLLYSLKFNKVIAFSILWFIVFYLPVSNILPHPNPTGYRLMYLPSIGIFAILAVLFQWATQVLSKTAILEKLSHLIIPTLLVSLMICTFAINFLWKNNSMIANVLVSKFPYHFKGHEILAKELYQMGLTDNAIPYYQNTIALNNTNPNVYYELGDCFIKAGNTDLAYDNFHKLVEMYPHFFNGYFGLLTVHKTNKDEKKVLELMEIARVHLNQQDYAKLQNTILESVETEE